MLYLCLKDEVGQEVDESIHDLPKIGQGRLLTIDGDTVCEGSGMFLNACVCIYIYIFVEWIP